MRTLYDFSTLISPPKPFSPGTPPSGRSSYGEFDTTVLLLTPSFLKPFICTSSEVPPESPVFWTYVSPEYLENLCLRRSRKKLRRGLRVGIEPQTMIRKNSAVTHAKMSKVAHVKSVRLANWERQEVLMPEQILVLCHISCDLWEEEDCLQDVYAKDN